MSTTWSPGPRRPCSKTNRGYGPAPHRNNRNHHGLSLIHISVDNGNGLRPGDVVVGPEGAVGVALDQIVYVRPVDLVAGPVPADVAELVLPLVLAAEEADGDGGEFGTGDGRVGIKQIARLAVEDTGVGQRGHSVVVPGASIHVAVGIALAPVVAAGVLCQQTEEDGSHLGAGDLGPGMDQAVVPADDVGKVVALDVYKRQS